MSRLTINDIGQAETRAPLWSLDGKSIFFSRTAAWGLVLYRVDEQHKVTTMIDFKGVVMVTTCDAKQTKIAYVFGTMEDPGQVYVADLKDGKIHNPRQLTRFNRDWLDRVDLGTTEEIWFEGGAGNKLQGWIIKPPNFDPKKKYPSVLQIHGGPLTQYGFLFMHEFYYLAAQGLWCISATHAAAAAMAKKRRRNSKNLGKADYADLMAWRIMPPNCPTSTRNAWV